MSRGALSSTDWARLNVLQVELAKFNAISKPSNEEAVIRDWLAEQVAELDSRRPVR